MKGSSFLLDFWVWEDGKARLSCEMTYYWGNGWILELCVRFQMCLI